MTDLCITSDGRRRAISGFEILVEESKIFDDTLAMPGMMVKDESTLVVLLQRKHRCKMFASGPHNWCASLTSSNS